MKKNTIQQMVIGGLLIGLAILIGAFTHFSFFGEIYLIGLIIFIMPLFLRIDILLISSISSVVLADLITGFGHYAWMSAIVYSIAVVVLWLCTKLKLKLIYVLGLFIAAGIVIVGYYLLELTTFDQAYAIKDAIGTSIEMAIVVPVVSLIYFPMKIVGKILKK